MNYCEIGLDAARKEPLYEQLYQYIVREIKAGRLRDGERIPSKRELCAALKISHNTVETAYELLVTEGYLRPVPKSGYYVCALQDLLPDEGEAAQPEEVQPSVQEEAPCAYDFRTSAVDTAFFPYATWGKITKEIMKDNRELLNHGHPQGDLPLREVLASYLREYRGVKCGPEQIVVGAGGDYLLGLTAQLLDNRVYALENPGYERNCRVIRNNGRAVRMIGLDSDGMRMEELRRTDADLAYVTPSHQFPMGIIMPVRRRMELLAWAKERPERYLIEDDYDGEFRFSGRPIPALQGLSDGSKVIYISSFSKSIAPSIRIACMVLPLELLEKYRERFGFYASTVSRFEQHCLYRFIRDGHFTRHLARVRTIYKGRKEMLTGELERLPIGERLTVIGENAGLHLLLTVRNGMSEEELVRTAKEQGVRVYGLSRYCLAPATIPESTVVLGYAGLESGQIENAARLLDRAWSKA